MTRGLLLGAAGVAAGLAARSAIRTRQADMRGEVVLITGGSRGLGLALATEFSGLGCRIAICARSERELEAARTSLSSRGADVAAFRCDITDNAQVLELVRKVRSRFGRIDTLVNNAGIIKVAPVENMTISDFEDAMAVMFWGVVYPTLAVLPEMRERGRGRIAAITSIGGKVSVPHLIPYCCAKFAAVAFCEGLRAEMAHHGVKVTTIAPGLMRTGSYRKAEFKGKQQQEAAWFSLAATLPLLSMGAERAARQVVKAIRLGQSEKILTTQATLLARFNGAFPGLVPDMLGTVNHLLPGRTADRESVLTGAEAEASSSGLFRAFTILGRRAARRLNEEARPIPMPV
jgi:NAD(P)-dependent dehydrogenase (short-subunit alcohol dehydrogenase family)